MAPWFWQCLLALLGLASSASTQAAQTVTWISPTNAVLALGRPFPLSATASSGLPVTFRVESGPAIITNGLITATNVGQIVLAANQGAEAGDHRTFNTSSLSLQPLGSCHLENGINGLQVVGSIAYAAGRLALQIIDLSNPNRPSVLVSYPFGMGSGVQVIGNLAYFANQSGGLQIFDVSVPTIPAFLGGYFSHDGYATGVHVAGKLAYIAAASGGLQIVDVSDPAAPVLVGIEKSAKQARAVQVVGNFAYVANVDAGLWIIDVSNPAAPVHVGSFNNGAQVLAVQVAGNFAYVANDSRGLQVLDIRDPANPLPVGHCQTRGSSKGVQVMGTVAYVADAEAGLQIIDVSNPAGPVRLGGDDDNRHTVNVLQVIGNLAYAGGGLDDGLAGLQILEVVPSLSASIVLSTPNPPSTELFLTPEVRGTGPATFQWFLDDRPIAGETNAFLRLQEVNSATAGNYTVEVTTALHQVRSEPAIVYPPTPVIIKEPSDLVVVLGEPNQLSVNAVALSSSQYQWRHEGAALIDQTNNVLPFTVSSLAGLGDYDVVVSNPYGMVTSRVARVTPMTNVVEFATNALTVTEIQGALSLPLRRSGSTDALTLPVRFGGNAVLNADYLAGAGASVPKGSTGGTLGLRLLDDAIVDGTRTLTVTLVPDELPDVVVGTNATLVISITDNDSPGSPGQGFDGPISAITSQPDGRVLVAGSFQSLNGQSSPGLARLRPDLSLDPAFHPAAFLSSGLISKIIVQPDGGIALLGQFSKQTSKSSQLRRLLPDGSEDQGFLSLEGNTNLSPPPSVTALDGDGSDRLLLAGRFGTGAVDGSSRALIRLLPDGSRDPVFTANLAGSRVGSGGRGVVQLRDGRLVLAGDVSRVSGVTNRGGIVRLFPDGNPDETFATGTGLNNTVNAVTLDRQERVLVAGVFSLFNGKTVPGWVRLNADGSLDSSFVPTVSGASIRQMEVLRGGQILVRTTAGAIQLHSETGALLNTYGTSDSPFAVESSGSILIGTGKPAQLRRLDAPTPLGPELELEWGSLTVSEAATEVRLPLRRTGPATDSAQVAYHVQAGTAVAGVDFLESSGVVHFAAGIREASLTFPLSAQNGTPNDDRTILVQLDSAEGASLTANRTNCVMTLEDDDVGMASETFAGQPSTGFEPDTQVTRKSFYQNRLDQHRDAQIYFEWEGTGPRGCTNDFFSIIWTGWIVPEVTGEYKLATLADDAVRMWLDGKLACSSWTIGNAATTSTDLVQLEAGIPHRLVVNYAEQFAGATCRLLWSLPGTNALTPIPRRVLRPGAPEFTPPAVSGSGLQITYASEAGRPVTLQTSTNGTDWKFLREAVSVIGGVTNSFLAKATEVTDGALLRAISVDGLTATNALPPLIRVNGSTNGTDITLFAGQTNAVSLSVAVYEGIGQSIAWLRDGAPVASGSPLVVSGLDPLSAGVYQAVVSYPFGQVTSNLRRVSVMEIKPPVISTSVVPTGGSFQIHVEADPSQPGQTVRLDVSTDLQHWETVISGTGSFDFALPASSGPAKFFRAVVE